MVIDKNSRIFVAGHRGMVGSAIVRHLRMLGYTKIITRTRDELDLTDQQAVRDFMSSEQPDYVILAAAKVGGIHANNTYPAAFIYQNQMIETNVIHEAWRIGVHRLLFLGSSCIYPKYAKQPMREEALLTGPLEPTNEPYAVAKIAGIKLCESYNRQFGTSYRCVMPTNLYGPRDNFDLENSHVIPALLRKFHLAKLVEQDDIKGVEKDEYVHGPIPADVLTMLHLVRNRNGSLQHGKGSSKLSTVYVWGTGEVRREFLHVDDLAPACTHVMNIDDETWSAHTDPRCSHINVGTGDDLTIRELAESIKTTVGFMGKVIYLPDKPEGSPRKLLDVSRLQSLGWRAKISLVEGLSQTYKWYYNTFA